MDEAVELIVRVLAARKLGRLLENATLGREQRVDERLSVLFLLIVHALPEPAVRRVVSADVSGSCGGWRGLEGVERHYDVVRD